MKPTSNEWGKSVAEVETRDQIAIAKLLQEELLQEIDLDGELLMEEITVDCICGVY
ncbi:MAG: hypothetical protein KGZ96_09110 [Clostridia bacterium]|jgi:hypothetical protein|nr:hypothetical protein [Clostridia bacterium]